MKGALQGVSLEAGDQGGKWSSIWREGRGLDWGRGSGFGEQGVRSRSIEQGLVQNDEPSLRRRLEGRRVWGEALS